MDDFTLSTAAKQRRLSSQSFVGSGDKRTSSTRRNAVLSSTITSRGHLDGRGLAAYTWSVAYSIKSSLSSTGFSLASEYANSIVSSLESSLGSNILTNMGLAVTVASVTSSNKTPPTPTPQPSWTQNVGGSSSSEGASHAPMTPAEVVFLVLGLVFLACALAFVGHRCIKTKSTHVSALQRGGGGDENETQIAIAKYVGERPGDDGTNSQPDRFSSAPPIAVAIRSPDGGKAHKPGLGEFLGLASLAQHERRLEEEGFKEVGDLVEAADADLIACGLKKIEVQRLRRYLQGGEPLKRRVIRI